MKYSVLILLLIVAVLFGINQQKEIKRLKANQTTLLEVKPENRLVLSSVESNKKIKLDTTLNKTILPKLKIKPKNVEGFVKAGKIESIKIETILRDTVIYKDTVKSFHYKDKLTAITGKIEKDSVFIEFTSKDTLYIIHYWKREGKFLPKLFGRKVFKSSVTGINKNIHYTILENIKKGS